MQFQKWVGNIDAMLTGNNSVRDIFDTEQLYEWFSYNVDPSEVAMWAVEEECE